MNYCCCNQEFIAFPLVSLVIAVVSTHLSFAVKTDSFFELKKMQGLVAYIPLSNSLCFPRALTRVEFEVLVLLS